MNTSDLKLAALLREGRPAPSLPPHFQPDVWRRIEDAEAPEKLVSWLDTLAALILRPRFALVAVAVLLLAGILAGTIEGQQRARVDARTNYLASVAPHAAH